MWASRGFEYACSERWTLVRIPNRDVLPTCGRPMMPVFMGSQSQLSYQLSAVSYQCSQKNKSLRAIRVGGRDGYQKKRLPQRTLRFTREGLLSVRSGCATLGGMRSCKIASRCRLFCRFAAVLTACVSCVLWSSAQTHAQAQFRLEPRATIEKRLKSFADSNQVREDIVREWFGQSGCVKPNLSEE